MSVRDKCFADLSPAREYLDANHTDNFGNPVRRTVTGLESGSSAFAHGVYTANELKDDGFRGNTKKIAEYVGRPWTVELVPVEPLDQSGNRWYFGNFSDKAQGDGKHANYYVRYTVATRKLDFFAASAAAPAPLQVVNSWTPVGVRGTEVSWGVAQRL